jgi:hypothetical protein
MHCALTSARPDLFKAHRQREVGPWTGGGQGNHQGSYWGDRAVDVNTVIPSTTPRRRQ